MGKKNWVKLNLFYVGESKKHQIFRATKWSTQYEKIENNNIFNQQYEKIGLIKDIFGPIKTPFISVKKTLNVSINHNDVFYTKI